jgi:two-component system, NarL family, invasion response regulator UvrY
MIRLLIVDDHMIFREGVKKILGAVSHIELIDEAADGGEALRMISENAYDVVLLDLALPGMSGLDVLRTAKRHHPDLAIVILSMYAEDEYAVKVLKEGASGYLTKRSTPGEIIKAITKAAQGGIYVSDTLAEKLAGALKSGRVGQPHETLSSREFQVFRMLASGRSIKDIASTLLTARTTISGYRARILEKMNMKSNAELVRYATEHQLVPDEGI